MIKHSITLVPHRYEQASPVFNDVDITAGYYNHLMWSTVNNLFAVPTAKDCLRYAMQEVTGYNYALMRKRLKHLHSDRESNELSELADTLVMLYRYIMTSKLHIENVRKVTFVTNGMNDEPFTVIDHETSLIGLPESWKENKADILTAMIANLANKVIFPSFETTTVSEHHTPIAFIGLISPVPMSKLVEIFQTKIETKRLGKS